MNHFLLTVAVLTVLIGLSATYDISTSIGHIKSLIETAKSRCPNHCQDRADDVLSRTSKSDICSAVDVYQVCSLACALNNPVTSEVHDAQRICDGAGAVQVSIILLLLTAIARFLF